MAKSVTLNQTVFTDRVNHFVSEMKVAIDLSAKSLLDCLFIGDI
jgi:hypothetical protein